MIAHSWRKKNNDETTRSSAADPLMRKGEQSLGAEARITSEQNHCSVSTPRPAQPRTEISWNTHTRTIKTRRDTDRPTASVYIRINKKIFSKYQLV